MIKVEELLKDPNYSLSDEENRLLLERFAEADLVVNQPFDRGPMVPLIKMPPMKRLINLENAELGNIAHLKQGYHILRIPQTNTEVRYYLINRSDKLLGEGAEGEIILSPVYFTREGQHVKLRHVKTAIKRLNLASSEDEENVEPETNFQDSANAKVSNPIESDEETAGTAYRSEDEPGDVAFDTSEDELTGEDLTLESLESRATTEAEITKQRYKATSEVVVDRVEHCAYFATKFHPGKDSSKAEINVDRGWLSINLCAQLFRLHHLKIRHADIKPENIMFFHDPDQKRIRIRYVDFSGSRHDLILNDHEIYTNNYRAPELRDNINRQPTYHSDIYSLACVINYCCRGSVNTFRQIEQGPHEGEVVINRKDFPTSIYGETIFKVIKKMAHDNPNKRLALNKAISLLISDLKTADESEKMGAFKSRLADWMIKRDESQDSTWAIQERIIKLLSYHPDTWNKENTPAKALAEEIDQAIRPASAREHQHEHTKPPPTKISGN